MMPEPWTLRRRMALVLTALAVAASALLALAFWSAEEYVEARSLRDLLRHELQLLASAEGAAPPAAGPATLRYFRPAAPHAEPLPRALRPLAPDSFTRVLLDGRAHQVLVTELAPGDRAYLAYDLSFSEQRGYRLLLMVLASTLVVALAAWWIAGYLAPRALAPVTRLVEQIRQLDLRRRGQRLTAHDEDASLQVIVSALNVHMAELDALVESEQAFAAAASHELRTPLGVISGAAAVLGEMPQVPKAVLGRIERAVAQASQDLEALLALSRTREKPALSPQRLDVLLPQIATFYEESARQAGTRVQWELAAVTRAVSPGALSIVFTNLLRNALGATPGGQVRVRLDEASLSVTDDGPGLPAALRAGPLGSAAILQRRADGGSGMGLYIAHALAQRNGWRLALHAAEGGGTRAELCF